MARKKKPHGLHLLQGTRRKSDGKLKSLPPPVTSRWNVPKWVGKWGKEYHKAHFKYAESMGTVTGADKSSWWLLCQRYHRIRELEAAIDEYGPVVKGRGGEVKRNPAASSLKAEIEAFRKERQIFGLDPESRAALGFKFPSPGDAYQRYMDRKSGKPSMQDLIDGGDDDLPHGDGMWVD